MSGLIFGTIVSIIIFTIILFNVDNYISFMNMDISTYKNFTIYSILQLFICLEFAMMQDKLYYEEKNKLANKHSLVFNLLNFILLIGTSLITKNQVIIISTTLIPLVYGFYDLDFKITMIYFSFEIVNFLIYPIYRIKTCYLQLEYSAFKTTSNKIIASILRMFISLLKTPFCTGIGQVCSSIYQFITVSIMFGHNFKIDKTGYVVKKINIE